MPERSSPRNLLHTIVTDLHFWIPVIVLAALSEPTQEELLNEGATACMEKSDKLLENDSAALIHTVTQIAGKAKVSME